MDEVDEMMSPTAGSIARHNELPPAYSSGGNDHLSADDKYASPIGRDLSASNDICIPAIGGSAKEHDIESQYAFLSSFDTIFLIDDSTSMTCDDSQGSRGSHASPCALQQTRWKQTGDVLGAIAPICTEFDSDGIDIWFLNHRNPRNRENGSFSEITTTAQVQEIFGSVRPSGATPTGSRLKEILDPHLARVAKAAKEKLKGRKIDVKPLNIIVVTDGQATDDPEATIVSAAKSLDSNDADPWSVGVQFFQIGNDPVASESLRELDDALSANNQGMRDMVDTVRYFGDQKQLTADYLLKAVLGSVTRRLDRKAA